MKITNNGIENYEMSMTIEVEAAELTKAEKRASKALASRVSIPGFRKGKVPQKMLEQYLGKGAVLEEAANLLIQKNTNDALKMQGLIPVTEPKAEIVTCEEGKDLVFKLTFTPYPKVELGEYKGLEVEKVVKTITDEDVDKQIENIRKHHATLVDAPEGAAVANGDFITLDFVGTIDGEKFEGGEAKDHPLEIGSHSFIDDFEEQLIGTKIGEEKTVNVTFPEDYPHKDYAGKAAVFECKINSIKQRELPEVNDELAKKASKFETLDEFKADIRKNMEEHAKLHAVEDQQNAVIEKAVENMKIDLPPVMIETRIDQMIEELKLQLQSQNLKIEQYLSFSGMDVDKLRESYRETAKKNVLTDIMLDEVALKENIAVDKKELDFEIEMMSKIYRTPVKQVEKFLKENGQMINIVTRIRRRKTSSFIIANMAGAEKVEEKSEEKTSDENKD